MNDDSKASRIRAALSAAKDGRDPGITALKALADAYMELESVITWETTCGNCARLLDSSYESYREGYEAGLRDSGSEDDNGS